MTDSAITQRLDDLTTAFITMAKLVGARLNRAEVCDRMRVHRNTLTAYMRDKDFPKPCRDGRWLLSEVVAWEALK